MTGEDVPVPIIADWPRPGGIDTECDYRWGSSSAAPRRDATRWRSRAWRAIQEAGHCMQQPKRFGHWMRSTVAPVLWPDGAETCPRCQRPIPGAFAPGGPIAGIAPRAAALPTIPNLHQLCPIDGELGVRYKPSDRTAADLRDVAVQLEQQLRSGRNRSWAKLFHDALSKGDDEFVVLLGHSVAVLLPRGPSREVDLSQEELEQLLVDIVASWPRRSVG